MVQVFIIGMGLFGLALIVLGILIGVQSRAERRWYDEPDRVERALLRTKLRVVRPKRGK